MNNLNTIALIIMISLVVIEVILRFAKQRQSFDRDDMLVNIWSGAINSIVSSALRLIFAAWYFWLYKFSFIAFTHTWMAILTAYLAYEFMYYWLHRFAHEHQVLWTLHIVHHSSREYNFTISWRSSVLIIPVQLMYYSPIALLGIELWQFMAVYYVCHLYSFAMHTTLLKGFGILEYVFLSPRLHAAHHAFNEQYIDRNYGLSLILYDRLFHTFAPYSEKPEMGLKSGKTNNKYFTVQFGELNSTMKALIRLPGWWNKVRLLFARPGDVVQLVHTDAANKNGHHYQTPSGSIGGNRKKVLKKFQTIEHENSNKLNVGAKVAGWKGIGASLKSNIKKPLVVLLLATMSFSLASQETAQLFLQARHHEIQWEEQQAFTIYRELVMMNPNDLNALKKMCWLGINIFGRIPEPKIAQAKLEGLQLIVETALDQYPGDFDLILNRILLVGMISERETSVRQKVSSCREIRIGAELLINMQPKNPAGYYILGKWHWQVSKLNWAEKAACNVLFGGIPGDASMESALASFKKALELDPGRIRVYYDLAKLNLELGKMDETMDLLAIAKKIKPDCRDEMNYSAKCQTLMNTLNNQR